MSREITIENGAITLEVNGDYLSMIKLTPGFRKPDIIHIPHKVDGCTIRSIQSTNPIKSVLSEELYKTSIIIDDKISSIADDSFAKTELNELIWPASCHIIPTRCFQGAKINSISGLDKVKTIGKQSFDMFSGIKTFTIPDSCTLIRDSAFERADIVSIIGGTNVKKIGRAVFSRSTIRRMHWDFNVASVPYGVFSYCVNLKEIIGMHNVFEMDASSFYGCGIERFSWPDNCKVIPPCCFADCQNLKTIDNLRAVTEISDYAFENCESLEEFNFPDELMKIGTKAFANTGLKNVDLSGTMVETIGYGAFEDCKSLHQYKPSICCTTDVEIH